MAVEPAKIRSMMEGRTLTGDNIRKMYQMVKEAEGGEDTEKKKQVMKHSVFFAGQLPLLPDYEVDIDTTRKYLLASVPYDAIDEYMDYLTEGLATQKLLLKKGETGCELNARYENAIAKATKVARAFKADQEANLSRNMETVKKIYQTGTRHYHAGQYEEAFDCFKKAAAQGEYRMAYYSLALMYKEGKGVDRDLKKALSYACKALYRGALIADALADDLLQALDA